MAGDRWSAFAVAVGKRDRGDAFVSTQVEHVRVRGDETRPERPSCATPSAFLAVDPAIRRSGTGFPSNK
jgi:hypothetical protein